MEHINGYEFGPFWLDVNERALLREGQPLSIANKTLEVLLVLIERGGILVEKKELMNRLWPDQAVEEGNLTQHIYSLRKALGEGANRTHYIQTVPRRGYRFTGAVKIHCSRTPLPNGQARPATRVEIPNPAPFRVVIESAPANLDLALLPAAAAPALRRWPWKMLLAVLFSGALLVAMIAFARHYFGRPLSIIESTRLTQRGDVAVVVTAPDAQSLAFVSWDAAGNQGLWLKQLDNHSELTLVPPGPLHIGALAYAKNANYLYYLVAENVLSPGTLYKYPLPGGPPVKVLGNMPSGNFALSPTNEQVAYTRRNQAEGVSRLFIANLNGTGNPRVLAEVKLPNILRNPAWSPDDNVVACTLQHNNESAEFMTVTAFEVATGRERAFSSARWWRVTDLTWLGEGKGLAVVAMETMSGFSQVYALDWPGDARRQLTNGPVNYGRVSASADGATLMTIESKVLTGVWFTTPGQHSEPPRKLLAGDFSGMHGLSVTLDERLLFTSGTDGAWDIWSMSVLGGPAMQLTQNAKTNFMQAASPDGRSIIFASNRANNYNIWRMGADGKKPQPLTSGKNEGYPRLAPDGTWFVYTQGQTPRYSLWRRNTAGGDPVKLAEPILSSPAISPDGRLIAYINYQGHQGGIEVIPAVGGAPLHKFSVKTQNIQWHPSGNAITFARMEKEAGNLWNQPLDGSAPQQITFFDAEEVYNFDWLPDGKRLVCVRALSHNDVIKLRLAR